MANVILRQEAINDLNNIWEHTFEKWSEAQADKYYAMLRHAIVEIGKNPEIGKEYFEINSNLQGLQSGRHIIFYQVIDKYEIEIIRILHQRMNLKIRLNE